ncbi:hypothetical protein LPW11_15005 [Geomonas sp. RF6]|uniref:hypothetical protein n=1 Tax=Geomonas sp. RF6 TaxID=2897342 RepID=UPI001E44867A|nr:hypothetical protein [Geomonas sp. RF6]UFS69201.1 hypothetical protein LPW11_15005 [Geomonas sp. RF6]
MQKKRVSTLAAALLLAATAVPSAHAFDVGGANGWKFSTDGFLNVFATYESAQGRPAGVIDGELGIGGSGDHERNFRVRTGLLPVGIGFNINAPTTNGVDYAIRLGIYPQIQNEGTGRTDLSPNIDFREINMTATGAFGQVLAGRAINLYQAKNILTDMTLFSVGVVGPVPNGPTMGHIGYGYLYPNFDAQIRYTTPDMAGLKFAIAVGDPHSVGAATITDVPRVEAELSYATTFPAGKVQAWVSGLYNEAKFGADTVLSGVDRSGKRARSIGGAGGVEVGMGPLDLLASTYGGKGLGMLGISDFGALDATGKERQNFGFLGQATFMVTPVVKLGANYGQSRAYKTVNDSDLNIMKQQSATASVTYNVAKFVQLIAEYTWAQDRWYNGETQNANIGALGTFIYW